MKQRIFENWEFNEYEFLPSKTTEVELIESNGKKLKEGVLGIVKGPSFFGDSFSRNGRFYPKELWENALKNPEFKRNLERGLIFGCIGHPENYSLDELLASGAVAVRIKDVNFDGKIGNVTYEILDTPAGRILNTILRSGSKPYVSTRGFGSFLNETKEWNGRKVPILNPKDYYLESIDFVLNPGFLETNPELVESLNSELKKLQESNIKCVDGICNLQLNETQNKEVNSETKNNTNNKINNEMNDKVNNEINNAKNENKLFNLDKNELINIIEELKKENEYLLNLKEENLEDEKDNQDSQNNQENKEITKKEKLFFAYLEILIQLLKYLSEYENEYNELSDILEKEKITEEDYDKVKEICNKLKENPLDDSVLKIINSLLKVINEEDLQQENIKEGIVNFIYRWKEYENISNSLSDKLITTEQEKNILKETLTNLLDDIENYKKYINKLNDKIDNLQNENNKINNLYEELQKELIETINLNKILKNDISLLKENNKNLKNIIDEKNNKLNELNILVEKLNKENKSIKEKLDILYNEKNSLINKIKILKENYTSQLNEYKQEKQLLKEEIKEIKNKYKTNLKLEKNKNEILKEELKNTKNNIDTLKEKLNNLETKYNSLSIEKEKLQTQLETKLNNCNKEKNKLQENLNNIKQEKDILIESLNKKINTLLNQNDLLKEKFKNKENEFSNQLNIIEKLENKIKQLEKKSLNEIKENEKTNTNEYFIKYIQEKYKLDYDTTKLFCEKNNYIEEKIIEEIKEFKKQADKSSIYVKSNFEITEQKVENKTKNMLEKLVN